ncbi:hypothetical protein JCM9957A_11840 [Kineosporia succinea]
MCSPSPKSARSSVRDLQGRPGRLRETRPGKLPEKVLPAALEFIEGPLTENPRLIGKPVIGDLHGLFTARLDTFKIVYRITEALIEVHVVRVRHPRDAYRPS